MECWYTKVQINIYGWLLKRENHPIHMTFFNSEDMAIEMSIFVGDIDEVEVDGMIQFYTPPSTP